MENYEIKTVPFMGSDLVAARDNVGKIWVGVRWMCEGIGLTEGQMKRQITNIQADRVLSRWGSNLVLNASGYGNREVFCLELDAVPLWLAKINITPGMEKDSPEVADKLEQYQLKAKDVLAAAFIHPTSTLSPTQLLAETTKALAQQAEIILDLDQRVTALTDKANTLTEQTATLTSRMDNAVRAFSRPNTIGEWKVDTEMAIRAMSSSIAFRGRLYAELDSRAGCNLSARLTRTRNRARKNGLTLAQAKAINKMDIIASDKHLRNIFDGIIREHQAVAAAGGGESAQAVIDAEFVEVV